MKTWSDLKKERFQKDPEEAIAYLQASLEENSDMPELIIEAIYEVSKSVDPSGQTE